MDGGDNLVISGSIDTSLFAPPIRLCGARDVPDLDLDISMTWLGDFQMEVTVTVTRNYFDNSAPDTPEPPLGPTDALVEAEHCFKGVGIDLDSDELYFMWDWGEGPTDWTGPSNSGDTVEAFHTWSSVGTHTVAYKVKDIWEAESPWSDPSEIMLVARGDANGDGMANVGDAVFLISYIFKGGPAPVPLAAGDANCDGQTNVGDAVYLIAYIFKGGPEPGCPE